MTKSEIYSERRIQPHLTPNHAVMIYTTKYFKIFILISIILLVSLFSTDLKGQSISTVGEIYDYEINDVFHTQENGSTGIDGFLAYLNIQISNKYYSANMDSVFYVLNIDREYSGSDQPDGSTMFYIDTIYYTNLNSLINYGSIDSVYTSADYNGRKVNFSEPPIFEDWVVTEEFIDGCGGPYDVTHWYGDDEGYITSHRLRLLYFKKGLEEWGEPHFVTGIENHNFNNHLKVYPNPASDQLVLDLANQNNSSCSGIIYSITGKRIKEFSFSSIENNQLNISDLSEGLYIIRMNIDGNFYSATFVKN